MASKRIQGITIEIGGDTGPLQKALKGIDAQLSKTQGNLKDINKLLKLDPGNTELLVQKQKSLQKSIETTSDRLKELKKARDESTVSDEKYESWVEANQKIQKSIDATSKEAQKLAEQLKKTEEGTPEYESLTYALSQVDAELEDLKKNQVDVRREFGNPMSTEQYDDLQREIIETQQNLENLTNEYKNFGSVGAQQLQAAGDKIKGFGDKMGAVGGALTKYVTGPLMALGAGASAAFTEVDEGADKILVATGASGEALEDMEERMKSLATSIPTDFATAGDAIGAVNTRFGITGDALEELSGQYIKFAELNGSDVTNAVNSTQKALTAFGKSADDASDYLDVLTKVGQDTGVNVDKLSEGVTANASAFKALGMDLYTATTFMGNVEKSGADVSTVMSGLSKAQKKAAKDGKTLNQALADWQKKAKSGKKDTEALNEAYELFGKSGAQVFDAVKAGTVDFSDMSNVMNGLGNVVSDTFEATLDPADRFKTAMNAIKVTGAEIASVAMPAVSAALDKVRDVILKARDAWNGLSDGAKKAVMIVGGVAAALGPILTIGGKLVGGIGSAVGLIGKFAGVLHIAAAPALAIVVAVGALVAIFVKLWKTNDRFRNKFISMWQMLKKQTLKTIDSLKEGFEGIKKNLEPVIASVKQIWEKFTQFMGRVFQAVGAQITNKILSIQYIFRDLGKIISGLVSGDFSKVGEAFKHIGMVVKTYISTTIEWIKWVFKDIDFAELGSKILEGIKSAIEGVKNFLTGIDWKGVGSTIWNAIKSGFAIVKGWLLKLVLGDDYTPESGWGDAGAKIWQSIKDGFAAVGDWLLKLVLGDEYTPESGWGDAGAKIWGAIKNGFAAVGDWLLKLVLGDDYTPESGWGDAGAKIWESIKNGFAAVGDWLLKLVMGDDWTPESGWGDAGAKIWQTIKDGFAITSDWLKKLLLGENDYSPDDSWLDVGAKIWGKILEGLASAIDWLKSLLTDWTTKLTDGSIDFKGIGSTIGGTIWGAITDAFSAAVGWFKNLFGGKSDKDESSVKGAVASIDWLGLGTSIFNLIGSAFKGIADIFKGWFEGALDKIKNIDWAGLGNDMWEGIKGAFSGVVDFFTGIFDFSNIHIKMPHISVTSWKDIGPLSVPWGFSVDWYRKAYDNPVVFTQPTVLQTPAGLKGFGDGPGGEVVLSMAKLKELVGSGAGEQTVNITINAQPGQSAEDIAAAVKRVFVREMEQRSAAYA